MIVRSIYRCLSVFLLIAITGCGGGGGGGGDTSPPPPVSRLPDANFNTSLSSGAAPLEIDFSDTSTGNGATISEWSWDFGGTGTSEAQNPTHVFTEPGSYTVTLTVTTANGNDSVEREITVTENMPPEVATSDVYRAHTGFAIALPIQASDPEGKALSYSASNLPTDATLDPDTGVLNWVPAEEQLGPYSLNVTVTDADEKQTDTTIVLQIVPLTDCDVAACDAATGCEFTTKSIDQSCCTGELPPRIAEPDGPFEVLHVGQNTRGFGRLQHCDSLQVATFAQGGANISLHFEARAIENSSPVTIAANLETSEDVVFDGSQDTDLQPRPDGFAHALGLTFQLGSFSNVFNLEGEEANLTATLTDAEGVTLERQLRLKITFEETPDLKNPDQSVAPANDVGCVGCHRPVDPETGERHGIEDAHPGFPLECTDCHGGNNNVATFEEAHVFPPEGEESYIRNLPYDKLNEVAPEYVRFVNPGDLRVAEQSCGSGSPAGEGTGCHQSIVDSVPFSVMSTYAGHYKLPRFMAGGQGRDPTLAAVDVVNEAFDPDTAPEGTVGALHALREPEEGVERSSIIGATDIYLAKSCPTCHLNDFGPNDGAGKYRSSGCTSCHMVYDDDGLSQSPDPAIVGYFPPHPIRHEITSDIPTEQCSHCHFQGGRIGLAYRGIREGGFSSAKTPPNAEPWGQSIYGHSPGFYFTDEDSTNSIDETPPDLHATAGMVCADCHVGSDVHGDNHLYASELDQVGVRCEDCHGTVREAIVEDPADGNFKNAKGHALKALTRVDDQIILDLRMQDYDLEVPQIANILEAGINPRMTEAMGVDEDGFSHTDTMECYTCHNTWRLTCFGCHINVNDDVAQLNFTTGEISQGGISVSRDDYSTDFLALGMNTRGKITPLCSSMSIFMSYRVDRRFQYRDRVRQTDEGTVGFGWNPFHHHTTQRTPIHCDTCHSVGSAEEPLNESQLNETYGFGTGEFIEEDGDGNEYDLSRFLDDEGNLTSTFPHPRTGPVPAEIRERAKSVIVEPAPE